MITTEGGKAFLPEGCVLTIGNFDGMHTAHRLLISETVEYGRKHSLPAVVWSFKQHPQSMLRADSFRYLLSSEDKERCVAAFGADVYHQAEFNDYRDMSPEEFVDIVLIGQFRVKKVFCGFDFSFGKGGSGSAKELERLLAERGVSLTVLPAVYCGGEEVSSTRIRQLISEGDVEKAAAMLGRYYSFCLPVCHGRCLGRTLGAPTINQLLPQGFVHGAYGVYAVYCEIDGKMYGGVSNIGVKPTVEADNTAPVCETHIFDYNGDLYGKNVRVYLCKYLRAEKAFPSLDALKAGIAEDAARAREVLASFTAPKGDCYA